MSPVRMGVLVSVSLVAAIGFALIARTIASGHERRAPVIIAAAPAETPMVRVLVARRDLAPGDKLTSGDFNWQPWPAEGLNSAFITDGPANTPASSTAPATVKIETAAVNAAADKAHEVMAASAGGSGARMVGAIVRERILTGEPIVEDKVVHSGSAGVLAVTLDPGMRAMAVPLSAESAAGGFILPGDHVDVVQSRQVDNPTGGGKKFSSGSVLQNVRVLAIDQNTKAQRNTSVIGATATLEVTPAEADLLALSKAQGELTLILRSYADIAGGSTAASSATNTKPVEAGPTFVKVFRNGAGSDVAVAR